MKSKSALIAAAIVLSATAVQARDVTWSIGIQAPLHPGVTIGTVISNAPAYRPAPVFYAEPMYRPAPVVYAEPMYRPAPVIYTEPVYLPAPVYARPAQVVYVPRPVYAPRQVVYVPEWKHKGHRHGRGYYKQRYRGEHGEDRDDD